MGYMSSLKTLISVYCVHCTLFKSVVVLYQTCFVILAEPLLLLCLLLSVHWPFSVCMFIKGWKTIIVTHDPCTDTSAFSSTLFPTVLFPLWFLASAPDAATPSFPLYNPDVVFLQELVPPYVQFLKKWFVSYLMIEGAEEGYFTGMLLKKSRVTLVESEIVPYRTTQMMRNLLVAQVIVDGQKLCLMTSHLESGKACSKERMNQLHVVKWRFKRAPDDVTVVFGGDTNLRDAEVTKVGLPATVCDVWERLGKQEHCCYTWDTTTNTNQNISTPARFRFDRIYLRPAIKRGVPRLAPDHMALVGLEKLDCGRYTSDHWGIYCTFSAE
uniref:Tyrosyl-DNA phosphodiesterase 2 n=2 Tax=Oreochromis niloticus TaxID=8128 RepID=A0A669AYI6_ORENI